MAASTGQHSQIYIWLLFWDVLSSPRLHVLYRTECSSDLGMLYKLICWVLLVCLTWCSGTLRGWVWAKITSFLINLHHCGTLSGNTSLTVPSLIREAVCCTPSIEAVQWSMLGAQPAVLRLKLNSTMKFLTFQLWEHTRPACAFCGNVTQIDVDGCMMCPAFKTKPLL